MSILLSPAQVGGLALKNRVVMAPMCMYEVKTMDGMPSPFHFAHYGARAIANVGLIIQEATAVMPSGRLTNYDLGLWQDQQAQALGQLVDQVHYLGALMGVQLVHAGRKAQDELSPAAPSAIGYGSPFNDPHEMSLDEITETIQAFQAAALRAQQVGYDMVELHAAHGYLLNQFLSPLTNQRQDQYGGSLSNRYRIVKEIIEAVKAVFSGPIWVRISATAYNETGQENQMADWIQISQWLKDQGVACISVSTGGLIPVQPNIPIRDGYQVHFASQIKQAVEIDVATAGLLDHPGLCEYILSNQQADLILQGRPLLRQINWLADAAKYLHDSEDQVYNQSYRRGQLS